MIVTNLFNHNQSIIEAYGEVKKSELQGWTNTGPVAHIGGHTVDLVRHWAPDNSIKFFAHVYLGNKKVAEKQLFTGTHDDTTWNEQEANARQFLVDYTTAQGKKS